jgi:hypothetical protein
MPQPLRNAVTQELRVAKDSKPPRQSANVELAVELTPSRPPRFGERPLRATAAVANPLLWNIRLANDRIAPILL